MKKMKWLARAFALVLAASALFASHIPASLAQQCFICPNMRGMHTASFEGADWVGTLAWDACPVKKYLENNPTKKDGLCQKIKAQNKFTSFKDSCPSFAPYCEPDKSSGGKGTTAQKGTPSKPSRGGLGSIKPGEIPPVTTSPEPTTAQGPASGGIGQVGDTCGAGSQVECAEGLYCAWAQGATCGWADAPGTCAVKPEACIELYQPVCGCNGATHSNACMAASAGTSVRHDGACE